MRIVRQDALGGPDVLYITTVDRPRPGPTEVLVKVLAAGVNPIDWQTRRHGTYYDDPLPFTVGWDVAGLVEEVGEGVTRFVPGDHVLGMPRFPRLAAGYAEHVTGPSRHFALTPAGMPATEAAGLPLAGLTAWQILVDTADVQPGQRVLVHAAAGGVGHLAVQIAKARGAYVIGTASAAKHEMVRGLGADEVIDYRTTEVAAVIDGLDLVVDLVGGTTALKSVPVLGTGGLAVLAASDVDDRLRAEADRARVRVSEFLVEPDHAGLTALTDLAERGRLRVRVDTVLPLAEASRAHELSETGRVTGKIVLVP
ncbi:MAG TPA: NADP-dependent oxidoreductase [Actinomycetes bacterium]|nr:NADP-dependent oxidoreductase [Actinomycetes bacterium]